MNYSGEVADQVLRMTLNGIEVAARITGRGAERVVTLLYAMSKDQKQTSSKIQLAEMLKSEKPYKVFTVRDGDLKEFCKHAKDYGIRYFVVKDKKSNDGQTDLLIAEEDASKVNRILNRYLVSTTDKVNGTNDPAIIELLESSPANSTKEGKSPNPSEARIAKSPQSVRSSNTAPSSEKSPGDKPSVRQALKDIRAERDGHIRKPAVPCKTPPYR